MIKIGTWVFAIDSKTPAQHEKVGIFSEIFEEQKDQ